jgi:hypothetical protein
MIRKRTPLFEEENLADDNNQRFGLPDIGIPAEVLFNADVPPTQKILFGFIRNLAHTEKGCWASNKYLSNLLGVEKQTVSKGISLLAELKYIVVQFKTLPSGVTARSIYINDLYPHLYAPFLKEVFQSMNKGIVRQIAGYPIDSLPPSYDNARKQVSNKVSKNINVPSVENHKGFLVPSDFTKFWELYPSKRKGLKGKALTAFEKVCRPNYPHRPTWQRVRAALLRQQKSPQWKKDGGAYIPMASTWLNQKRWLDDAAEMKVHRFNDDGQQEVQSSSKGWIGNKFANA